MKLQYGNKQARTKVMLPLITGCITFLLSTSIFANPVLNNVAAGKVSIQQNPNSTVINQSSQKAIINWQSFNIGAQETTHFQQPQGGVALNRINPSQGVSQIYGRLTATGQIILVNPAGIFFGPGSYVNVGGMIATTMNITDQDFLNGYYRFANTPGYNGAIINKGSLIAADNGLIALIGGAVSNDGYIQANMGNVVLASGEAATMTFAGNDLVSFAVDSGVTQRAIDKDGNEINHGVSNTGQIYADGGRILISAKDAAGILDHVINMDGVAQALSVSDGSKSGDGEIILMGEGNGSIVRLTGLLDASGKEINELGGNITVTGYNILLDKTAALDVSGDAGGGTINIGGNYRGQGPLPNANAVVMQPGAMLTADAITKGDGGNVIIWSDDYTNVNGTISARGGYVSGNGGFIETSGKALLRVGDIAIDTSAPNGSTGTWLLDPTNLYIASSQANATSAGMSGTDSSASTGAGVDPVNFFANGAIQDSYLSTGTLTTALSSANVIVSTNNDTGTGVGDITVVDPISWSSAFDLRLSAYRNITVNGTASITNTGSGSIFLNADNTGTGSGGVTFGTGNAQVGAGGSVLIFYSPVTFGAPTALENIPYTGGTTPVSYQLISGLGTDSDASTERTLGSLSINSALWSQNFALAKNIDASATTTWNGGAGFDPIADGTTTYFTGKFHGQDFAISDLYINRPTENNLGLFSSTNGASIKNTTLINPSYLGLYSVGGFVGDASSSQFSYLRVLGGNITGITVCSGSCGGNFGGIAGYISSSTVDHAYNSANITAKIYIGGISGWTSWTTISDSYNTGTIESQSPFNKYTGGIAGLLYNNTVVLNKVYNSGRVFGIANSYDSIGAFTGWNNGATITNSFWDVDTTALTSPTGSGSTGTVNAYAGCATGNCTTSTASVSSNYLFSGTTFANLTAEATYTTTLTASGGSAWDITSTPSTTATAPSTSWFIFNGSTRPMLTSELKNNITNAHELQLMGIALGGNYTLASDIDFNTILNTDVWGVNFSAINIASPYSIPSTPTGFAPVGNNTFEFTGSFYGQNNTINNLYINKPSTSYVGLFGKTGAATNISNIVITNPIIYGSSYVSALVGYNQGIIDNSNVTSTSAAPAWIGGALLSNNYDIRAVSLTGGIAGYSNNSISNSHSKLNILSGYMGGIVGLNAGTVTNSYSSGRHDAGTSQVVGGLAGENTSTGQIINSFHDGYVSMGYYTVIFGGLVGSNAGLISKSYNLGSVYVGFGNSSIGGIVGQNLASGVIINSYNLGSIRYGQGTNGNQGGVAGTNAGTITNVYNAGTTYYQYDPSGTNNNGFVGANTGTINNGFWDMGTSGYTRGYASNTGTINGLYAGCFGNTTCNGVAAISNATNAGGTALDLTKLGTYTTNGPTWDMATIWNIIPDQSYPYLRDFYSSTPRAVSGFHPSGSRYLDVSIAYNGVIRDSTQTFYNGFAYFLEGNNLVSKVDNSIADGDGILVFTTSGIRGNFATYAPSGGASMSGANGFVLTANTITGANTEMITSLITPLTNAQIVATRGSLVNSNILFTGSGNNINVTNGYSFATTAATPYDLNGTISVSNGNITLNGTVTITIPSAALTTVTSGNVNVYNTIDGNNNALTINTVGTNSNVTDVMSNLSSFTKSGNGILTLSGVNTYTGSTSVTAGTLVVTNNASLGTTTGGTSVSSGGAIQLNASGLNIAEDITSLSGTGVSASGALYNLANNNAWSGAITLGGTGATIASSAGTFTLGTIDGTSSGTQSLTFTGAGNLALSAAIGNSVLPSTLTSSIATSIASGTIDTSGTQTYNSPITLANDNALTSTAGSITFGSTFNGAFDLTVDAATTATFRGVNTARSLTVTAPSGITFVNSSSVTTSGTDSGGDMIFNNAITANTLSASFGLFTLNGGSVSLAGVSGQSSLTVNAAGSSAAIVTANGSFGGGNASSNITASGGIILNAAAFAYQFSSTFNSPVTITAPSSVTGSFSSIVFNSTIDGPSSLSVSPNLAGYGGLTLSQAVGSTTPLSALTISGAAATINIQAPITVSGALTVTTNANFGDGRVNLNGPVGTAINAGSLSFTGGAGMTINGYIINTTGNQTYNISGQATVSSGPLTIAGGDVALTSSAGTISFLRNGTPGTIEGDGVSPRNLTTTSATGVVFDTSIGNVNPLNNLTVTGLATITGGATAINTLNDQSYNGGVSLGVNTSLSSFNGGDISFGTNLAPATINSARSLTINSGVSSPGNVNFWGAVGNTTALTALDVTGNSINVYGGSMRTSGAQTYRNLVTLFDNTVLTSTGSSLNLLANITSDTTARDLTLTAAAPTVLSGNLGVPNLLNSLTITNATTLGANINTINAQTYGGAVTLSADSLLTSTAVASGITFNNTINGTFALSADARIVTFNDIIGGVDPLQSLTSINNNGWVNIGIGATAITTLGAQTYTGAVYLLGTNLALTGTDIILNDALYNYSLTTNANLTVNGNLSLPGTCGLACHIISGPNDYGQIENLIVTGDVTSASIGIFTNQDQSYNGAITLTGDNVFNSANGGTITFMNTIQGPGSLSVNTNSVPVPGIVEFSGDISNINELTVVASTLNINTASISSTGSQSYNSAVVLGADTTLTSTGGGDIQFASTVDGMQSFIINTDGTVTFHDAVGSNTRLTSVTVSNDLVVNGGEIATTNSQIYGNNVTLGSATVFDVNGAGSQSISFDSDLSGGQDLTLQGTGTGSYNFTLNTFTANDVNVTASLGSSNNTLNLNTGDTQDFVITGTDIGNVNNIATINSFNFNNIQNLNGGSGADTFTFNGGTLSGSINGGAGTNILIAANVANTWTVNALNGGMVTGLGGSFSNIQNLTGGTALDTFNFLQGFSVDGQVDGGDVTTLNNIRFNTYTDRLNLYLTLPVGNVFDAGNVYTTSNTIVAAFTRVQQSDGNNLGYIFLPDKADISVTFYDSTLLNGEIADPFYFYGWNVGNPPTTGSPTTTSNPNVAPIVQQPVTNAEDNNDYSATYSNYGSADPSVINKTYIDPLLETTSVKAGAVCYQVTQ